MSILSEIQTRLVAPKDKQNKFGKYAYRNCEDIFAALKPLLAEHSVHVVVSDEIVSLDGRFYVKATARLMQDNKLLDQSIAYAREQNEKKGMDDAQLTGATSSYARKYALCGLFAIDGERDADSHDNRDEGKGSMSDRPKPPKREASQARKDLINAMTYAEQRGIPKDAIRDALNIATNGTEWKALTDDQMIDATAEINALGIKK